MNAVPVEPGRFREAMASTASGVAIVTTDGPAGRHGVTVSTLCSLSLEPPSVIVCIHRGNRALAALLANGVFAANVLAFGQERVADIFAGRVPDSSHDRFAEGNWATLASGVPALVGALCSFDCRLGDIFDFGSHRIVTGIVTALATAGSEPLVHSNHGYRRLLPA